ncbi:MAG: alpha/beta hydrolase [Flavobacteriaceae bacterium]|nr:alpha/beta hydrolase [Flavobacteriaceae bacterium]
MKRILFFVAVLFFAISHGQNSFQFGLTDGTDYYSTSKCLTPKTNYNKLNFVLVTGSKENVKDATLSVVLAQDKSYQFSSYGSFQHLDFLNWLKDYKAFKDFKKISFNLEITLTNGSKHSQTLTVCLDQDISRSITNKTKEDKNFIEIPLSFATDRFDSKNKDVNKRFSGKRGDLVYGTCVVSVPYNHQIGEIERPSYWRLEFSENPEKHVVLQTVSMQDKETYFQEMSKRVAKKSGKSTFLFVHGYNVSFADAARRTAQITFDLKFDGEPVFYSWPSQATTTGYTIDEANIEWAQHNMKNFLKDYLTKSGAQDIYLVAHSMGNRGLTKALIELITENPELKSKITEIILAAPDIDADVFRRDIAPKLVSKIQKPITLYVSSDDLALLASRKVHGNRRAGDAGKGIMIVKGVETIDASGVDTSFLSHSYFATTSTIIADILDLMKSGKRAADRETLERISRENVVYWKVKQKKN